MNRARYSSMTALWAWPLVLGVLTCTGLVSALFSDGGFGDILADICLGIPIMVSLWFGWLAKPLRKGSILGSRVRVKSSLH